jgi:hypothetical protein
MKKQSRRPKKNSSDVYQKVFQIVSTLDSKGCKLNALTSLIVNKDVRRVNEVIKMLRVFGVIRADPEHHVYWIGLQGFAAQVNRIVRCVNLPIKNNIEAFLKVFDSCKSTCNVKLKFPNSLSVRCFKFLLMHIIWREVPAKMCDLLLGEDSKSRYRTTIVQLCRVMKFGDYIPFNVPYGNLATTSLSLPPSNSHIIQPIPNSPTNSHIIQPIPNRHPNSHIIKPIPNRPTNSHIIKPIPNRHPNSHIIKPIPNRPPNNVGISSLESRPKASDRSLESRLDTLGHSKQTSVFTRYNERQDLPNDNSVASLLLSLN